MPRERRLSGIIWKFIEEREGASVLDGYVPREKSGEPLEKSGVTIASGVDLGQMGRLDVQTLGLPQTLVDKLVPYTLLRRHAAVEALEARPLRLTKDEADALDMAVRKRVAHGLALRYDAAVSGRRAPLFEELPAEAQTVLASVTFQYGSRLDLRCPLFWRTCVAQDWKAVVAELRRFNDRYPTRRNAEADLLERVLA
jgi:hypothetical protein